MAFFDLVALCCIIGLAICYMAAVRTTQLRSRAAIEREMFDAIQALVDSDKIGPDALKFLHGMLGLSRRFPVALLLCLFAISGGIRKMKVAEPEKAFNNRIWAQVPDELKVTWTIACLSFFVASTYQVPILGVLARSAFAAETLTTRNRNKFAYKVSKKVSDNSRGCDLPGAAAAH